MNNIERAIGIALLTAFVCAIQGGIANSIGTKASTVILSIAKSLQ